MAGLVLVRGNGKSLLAAYGAATAKLKSTPIQENTFYELT
jgi:hypothetical protein